MVAQYTVLEQIGAGGMGVVYLARDERLGRSVALKFIAPAEVDEPAARERLLREARSASALDHPNVATVYEVGSWNDELFLAMGYYPGETLDRVIARGPLPIDQAVGVAEQIATGLAAAHAAGITHRDLKPANVILTTTGVVKIVDFGLAKAVGPSAETEVVITRAGAVAGTAAYMAPEQARGAAVDQRADIWAFGVVLFEMLTGRRPFEGPTAAAVVAEAATTTAPPVRSLRRDAPAVLERLVERALVLDPAARVLTAAEAARDIAGLRAQSSPTDLTRRRRRRLGVAALVVVVALVLLAPWGLGALKRRWVVTTALPEIARLTAAQELAAAVDLAAEAERYWPGHPDLARLWPAIARPLTIESTPAGAEVSFRPYGSSDAWRRIGTTPIAEMQLPIGWLHVRVARPGFDVAEDVVGNIVGHGAVSLVRFELQPAGRAPAGMVRASETTSPISVYILGLEVPGVRLRPFWIDRTEVTNRDYQAFVDAGGYEHQEHWQHAFVQDGRPLPWDAAMARFRDATGRPGPATWELGRFPAGQEHMPVTGVSWYEAAAYAAFARKRLPTVYHWTWVATQPLAGHVIPLATFTARAPVAADTARALHRFGAVNLAGNVKEWTANESTRGKRYILGGGFDEPPYMFSDADARSPLERSTNFGFRCIAPDEADPTYDALARPIAGPSRDYSAERPVSDAIFEVYSRLYAYDRTELQPAEEPIDESHPDWSVQRITYNAAYGRERIVAYLYLPKNAAPPYQTIVYMPPASAWDMRTSAPARANPHFGYLPKSGRAVLFPIYKGTFERALDGFRSDHPKNTTAWRDHVVALSRDLGRSVDYLLTRPDVDPARIGFIGLSRGGALAPILLAMEPRISAAVLWIPGLYLEPVPAEADAIHFAPRARPATLVLSGRYDYNFPDDRSSLPFFNLLGTPPQHKRRVLYDTGHNLPFNAAVKETLDWFDKYFGVVR